MAFGGWVPNVKRPLASGRPGLGLLPKLRVLPHFDRYFGRLPDMVLRGLVRPLDGIITVGIDEDTALVGGPDDFTVMGKSSAWILNGHHRTRVEKLSLPDEARLDAASKSGLEPSPTSTPRDR
jgi:cyanophycinase